MTKTKFFAGLALAGLLLSTSALSPVGPLAVAPAQAQSASVSFNLFFDELEPHGVWVRHPQYRYVFCPTGVDTNWRPYTRGRWLNLADRGWYFDSDEPFAWATYHYGRWLDDDNLGWCWVPGTKWAPAWVSWRRSGNAIGWAPLPPERDGFSISFEVSNQDLPENYWVFVPTRSFIEPNLSVSIVFGSDARDYYRETEFLGPVVVQGDVVTNNVIEVTYIEQQINQQVTVYNVEEASDPAAASVTGEQTVQIFNQDIEEPAEEAAPAEAVDETEATEVIQAEGGTIGATDDAESTEDPNAAGEAVQTEDPADAETAEPETDATDVETEATDPVASDAEVTTDTETDVTTEDELPAVTTEEQTDAEQAADEEQTTAPAATEEEAAPAADETEQAAEPADAVTEEADETAAPADEEADQTEQTAPEDENATTPDCPPELLVDGVCQVPADDAGASPSGTEETSGEDAESSGSDAGESDGTEVVTQ